MDGNFCTTVQSAYRISNAIYSKLYTNGEFGMNNQLRDGLYETVKDHYECKNKCISHLKCDVHSGRILTYRNG